MGCPKTFLGSTHIEKNSALYKSIGGKNHGLSLYACAKKNEFGLP